MYSGVREINVPVPLAVRCTLFMTMRNDTITLRPRKLKIIGFLLISIAFVYGGFSFMDDKTLLKWSCIVFFSLGAIVFIIQLMPNSSYLKLTGDGFEMRNLYRSHYTKWDEIKSFRAGSISIPTYIQFGIIYTNKKMVFFDYEKNHKKHKIGKALSNALFGSQAALPDLYGMKVDDLAKLMNEWKNKNSVQHYVNPMAQNH